MKTYTDVDVWRDGSLTVMRLHSGDPKALVLKFTQPSNQKVRLTGCIEDGKAHVMEIALTGIEINVWYLDYTESGRHNLSVTFGSGEPLFTSLQGQRAINTDEIVSIVKFWMMYMGMVGDDGNLLDAALDELGGDDE